MDLPSSTDGTSAHEAVALVYNRASPMDLRSLTREPKHMRVRMATELLCILLIQGASEWHDVITFGRVMARPVQRRLCHMDGSERNRL
jgi:hypothetical protein